MAGQAKSIIDKLISDRSKGDRIIANGIRVKLILKGIDVDSFTADSPDDPAAIEQIKVAAKEFGINV